MLHFSSLRVRLLAGFIGVPLVLLIPCGYALLSLETLGERFRSSYAEVILPMRHWGDFRTEVATASSVVNYHVAELNPEHMTKSETLAIEHMNNADALLEKMRDTQGAAEVREIWSRLRKIMETCLGESKKFLKMQADATLKSQEVTQLWTQLFELLKRRSDVATSELEKYQELSLILNNRLKTQVTIGALVTFMIAVLVGLLLTKSIVRPIKGLSSVADEISKGNLAMEIPAQDRSDELGKLAQSFDRMLTSLRDQTHQTQDACNVLENSVSEIAQIISQVAAIFNQSSSAISETTTTVEQARQSAELSSQKAKAVAQTANEAATTFASGHKATEQTAEGIHRIKDRMESIREAVKELQEQSNAIGNIMDSVQDIADQSHILAVNASIEAARAGDHGRGFTVVSQEIKSLAEQSKDSTNRVRSILEGTRDRIESVLTATGEAGKAVDEGLSQGAIASQSLSRLSESVSASVQASKIIEASSGQQAMGMDQIVVAMRSIDDASRGVSENVTKLQGASDQLATLGTNLKRLVEHYKL